MKVIMDLCIVPMGVGVSVSRYIAACQPILTRAALFARQGQDLFNCNKN